MRSLVYFVVVGAVGRLHVWNKVPPAYISPVGNSKSIEVLNVHDYDVRHIFTVGRGSAGDNSGDGIRRVSWGDDSLSDKPWSLRMIPFSHLLKPVIGLFRCGIVIRNVPTGPKSIGAHYPLTGRQVPPRRARTRPV